MDVVLQLADEYLLDDLYARYIPKDPLRSLDLLPANASLFANASLPLALPPLESAWPRDHIPRQLLSLTVLTMLGIHLLYFFFAWASYAFIFDKRLKLHPRYLPNQIRQEIVTSVGSFPGMLTLMMPWFLMEVRGYSKLYHRVDQYGWWYFFASIPMFLLFTDYCIYWIHRGLHMPGIYKYIHKPHHKWIVPTPFASHAFHPVDGTAQGMPYHFFIFLFPMQRHLYLALFVFVNVWTVLIHDGDMLVDHPLLAFINGPAHHTLHHLYFTCNYGQYFTWADKYGGSFREPRKELDPLLEALGRRQEMKEAGIEEK